MKRIFFFLVITIIPGRVQPSATNLIIQRDSHTTQIPIRLLVIRQLLQLAAHIPQYQQHPNFQRASGLAEYLVRFYRSHRI